MLTKNRNLHTGKAVWESYTKPRIQPNELTADQKTDIIVIGAGISGAMVAEELSAEGHKVILLDKRGPMKGSTAASTALLQYEIDEPLSKLKRKIGTSNAQRAWKRSRLGVDSLAAKIQSLGIECDFARRNSLYLSGNILDADELLTELKERRSTGLYSDFLTRKYLREAYGINRKAALISFDNISVNPCKLTAGFLNKVLERGGKIYSPVEATEIETSTRGVKVITAGGPVISAKYLIFASGYELPKYIRSNSHKITSTWAIATKPQKSKLWKDECFIWEAASPYLYIRTTIDGRIICGGEDEDFSDEEKRDAKITAKTKKLEAKLAKLFPHIDAGADYSWAGSFGTSSTSLPSIGKVPGHANTFIMLGFGGNGITYSRIGAEIINSMISGRDDPDADLFKL